MVATVTDILPGESKATLILADGQSVALQSDSIPDITVGEGVNVKSSGHGIVYSGSGAGKVNLQYNTLQTPRGGEYQITLSDGSSVQLNSASQVEVSGDVRPGEEGGVFVRGSILRGEEGRGAPVLRDRGWSQNSSVRDFVQREHAR